jgi:hypothetical protein
MKILSFSLMMSLTLTLLTVGIVTAMTTIPTAEAKGKEYCSTNPFELCQVGASKKVCESSAGKGNCEKVKVD